MVTIRIRSWRPAMPSISGPRSTVVSNFTRNTIRLRCHRFVPAPPPQAAALDEPAGALAGGGQAADEGDRPVPRRDELPELVLGGARPAHRQRSRTRPHRTGAPATGADARRHDRSDAALTDCIGCDRLRGCSVNSSVARTRPAGRAQKAPERITGTSQGSWEEQNERYEHRKRQGGREQVDVA